MRRLAAFDDVHEERQVERLADDLELFFRLGRFDEDHVRPGLRVHLAASQRFIEAEPAARIGARNDLEVGIGPRLDGDTQLLHHLFGGDHAPARRVAAFFRKLLVFELDACGARFLVTANRMRDVEQSTVAGIAIADDRRLRRAAERLDAIDHIAVCGDPRIGDAEVRRDGPEAGHVQAVEAHLVGDANRHHVVDAGRDDDGPAREFLFQCKTLWV